jgi:hypothetical protein
MKSLQEIRRYRRDVVRRDEDDTLRRRSVAGLTESLQGAR